ncbi:MAG TPA: CBS domain-containing protein [Candidatus Binatia bacterium]|nr:CBS domain-containing protein [Candidatus Binatia bacterium]
MSVGRICVREVALADANETAMAAARRMKRAGVGTLIVLDQVKRPIGLVTDRDLVVRVIAAGKSPKTTRVRDVMTTTLKIIREDSPIEDALGMMRGSGLRRLPVVNREGQLVGIVSLDDVLALLAEEFALIGGVLKSQSA